MLTLPTRAWRVAVTAALLSAAGLTSTAAASETVIDRSAFSTTVKAGDAFKTRTYPEQINFKDDGGDWSAIDRALEAKSDGSVRPAAIDGDAVIPSTLTKPVVLEHDGRSVSFRLLGADAGADRDVSGSKASFDDALAGIDVSYKVRPNGLKELIELGSRSSQRSFSYDVRADSDLSAAIVGDDLVFKDDAGKERFRVAAPLAWDSAELAETSDALTLSVSKTADRQWRLTMRADDQWLDDPARVYPVSLDPDYVYPTPDNYWIDGYQRFHGANQDCAMAGNDLANQNRCAYTALQIGYGNGRPYKSVMKFDVASAIPSYARVTASRFLAWQFPSSQKLNQSSRLRTVTSPWDNTATWNKRIGTTSWTTAGGDVSTAANLTGDPITIGPSGYWSYWPAPLAAVSGWIKGTLPNYGFQISTDATSPTVKSAYEFTSTDGAQNLWPALEVTWVPDTTAPTGVVPAPYDPGATDQDDLAGNYAGTINASAQDDSAGVKRLELLRDADVLVATADVACPSNTCPLDASAALPFNTTGWSDGAHTFKLRATDAAGNVTTTSAWNVYVDRTAPVVNGAPYISKDGQEAWLSWDTNDVNNSDGTEGSGIASDSVRILTNGTWSAWTESFDSTVEVPAASTNLTVQIKTVDAVGNEFVAPQASASVRALTGQPNTRSVTLPSFNCEAEFGPGVCVDPVDDTQSSASFSALAADPNPYKATRDAKTKWGYADSDREFYGPNPVGKPYTASATVTAIQQGHPISSQRILVPFNIAEEVDGNPRWPLRYANLVKQLKAAYQANIPVLLTFENACNEDNAARIACSGTGQADKDRAPVENELNDAALKILRVRDGLSKTTGLQVGKAIKWVSVWNEPFFSLQPFRDKSEETGLPSDNDGEKGLRAITRDLADPQNGACTQVKWCQVVAPEVTFSIGGSKANTSAYEYASWLRKMKKRWDASPRPSNADVSFARLKFYGAHPYAEVENAWDDTTPNWKTSRLARYMSRLPDDANVWLAEIGVFGQAIGQKSLPPAQKNIYTPGQRAKQADFLFNKLGRIKLGRNGAQVARANYYQVCAGAPPPAPDAPAPTTPGPASLPFDTSLHDGQYNGAKGPNTDCTSGLTARSEVVEAFQEAIRWRYKP